MKRKHSVYVWVLLVAAILANASFPLSGQVMTADIALLDSANTKEFFSRHYPMCNPQSSYYLGADEYQRYFRGWQWLLDVKGFSYDVVTDEQIVNAATTADGNRPGLGSYKILILSNAASLSDAQISSIHKWVIGGGRLLATFGSGYKDIISDPREIDGLKQQKGGTFGLHQLWHDPIGKLFSSYWIDPGVEIKITRYEGPTSMLAGILQNDILPYGAMANLLIQRPVQYPNALGYLVMDNPSWKSSTPAIISTRQAKGLVVYLAFAPEYIVYKELEYAAFGSSMYGGWPTCTDQADHDLNNWSGRSADLQVLMQGTLEYLSAP